LGYLIVVLENSIRAPSLGDGRSSDLAHAN
jgi:hypothetical protein